MYTNNNFPFNAFSSPFHFWTALFNETLQSFMPQTLPDQLTQPILPGWMFANEIHVTKQNSNSPETERDIVAKESYGKQIGRLMDAVMALIDERPKNNPGRKEFKALSKQFETINEIKSKRFNDRVKSLESELEYLRDEHPEEFRKIAKSLMCQLDVMEEIETMR